MKHWLWRAAAATAVLFVLAMGLTACGDKNDAVIIYDTDPTEAGETAEDTNTTNPTQPIPEGRMALTDLMVIMGPDMAWSDVSDFEHTDISDSEASFTVQNNSGQTCTLTVTYDKAADTVSKATLSCGDVELDALSGETAIIRKILVAMNQQG